MALTPDDRYATPAPWPRTSSAGWPTSRSLPTPSPGRRRARRWARRHKTPVAIAGSLLLASVVALAVGLVLVRREQARTEAQRDLASRNFRQARQAADGFLTRISDDSQLAQPDLQPLRRRLLEAGLSYYEGFAREGLDPGDHARLADAYARVGRINDLVGSKEKALADVREAVAYREKVAGPRPDDPAARRELAAILDDLGHLQMANGRMAEALPTFERARDLVEPLARDRPDDRDALKVLADTLAGLGEWQNRSGARDRSIELHRRAVDLFERLASGPADPRAKADLARGLVQLGIVQTGARLVDDALRSLRRARDLREDLVLADPADSERRNALAVAVHWLAVIHYGDRQLDQALEAYQQSRGLREELVATNTVFQYQDDLARDHDDIGSVHREAGRLDEALQSHHKAREIRRQLVRFHPAVPAGPQPALRGADIDRPGPRPGRPERRGAGLLRGGPRPPGEAGERPPGRGRVPGPARPDLRAHRQPRGGVVTDDRVLAMLRQAREIREGLLKEHPDDPEYLNGLSNSLTNLGRKGSPPARPARPSTCSANEPATLREKVLAARPGRRRHPGIACCGPSSRISASPGSRRPTGAPWTPSRRSAQAVRQQGRALAARPEGPAGPEISPVPRHPPTSRSPDLQRALERPGRGRREPTLDRQKLRARRPRVPRTSRPASWPSACRSTRRPRPPSMPEPPSTRSAGPSPGVRRPHGPPRPSRPRPAPGRRGVRPPDRRDHGDAQGKVTGAWRQVMRPRAGAGPRASNSRVRPPGGTDASRKPPRPAGRRRPGRARKARGPARRPGRR